MEKAAPKTYLADHKNLSVSLTVDGKPDAIGFVDGKFVSDLAHEQEAIEATELFRSGHVRLAPGPRDLLVAKAEVASAAAESAESAAVAAEKDYTDFVNRPKVLRAEAEQAKKDAAAAVAAVSDYDKKGVAPVKTPAAA